MGFGVGVTYVTGNCAGKRSPLTKAGKPRGKQAGARALLCEMGTERWSATHNLDRERSAANVYGVGGLGHYTSGQEAYAYVCSEVDAWDAKLLAERERILATPEYRSQMAAYEEAHLPFVREHRAWKRGGEVGPEPTYDGPKMPFLPRKGVREDAPVIVSSIVEPKTEWVATRTREELDRFFDDAALALVECGFIDRPDDVLISVVHWDEAVPNLHVTWLNRDPETGRIGEARYTAKRARQLNVDWVELMRAKDWDVEPRDITDLDRLKTDPKYEAERKCKRRQQGRTANAYAAAKEEQKARERAEAANREAEAAEAALDAAQRAVEAAQAAEAAMDERYAAHKAELERQLDEWARDYGDKRQQEVEAKVAEDAKPIVAELNAKQRELRQATADVEDKRAELAKVAADVESKRAELAGAEAEGGSDGWDEVERLADETIVMRAKIEALTRENDQLAKRLRVYERAEAPAPVERSDRDFDAPGC